MTTQLTRSAKIYDNSMLSGYKGCPRYYQLRYKKHWRSEGTAIPLVFGLSWHAGQDALWLAAKKGIAKQNLSKYAMLGFEQVWTEEGIPFEMALEDIERYAPRTPSVAAEMYENYIEQRWKILQESELLSVEQPFAVPVPGLEGRWYVGRLDKVVKFNGQGLVIEHKTTTEYKKDGGFRSTYVESWYTDSQCKGYQFGGSLFYDFPLQVWVDAALVHKKEHDKFRFIPIEHQVNIIEEWLKDTKDWIERVERDTQAGYFPRNENNCVGKYGQCTFINICRTTPDSALGNEPPPGFMVEKWEPFDLLKLEKLTSGG